MKLKVGIIGLGVGESHIKGYGSHPNCEVVALCDFSDEKRALAKTKYSNLRFAKDASEILLNPDIDVVSIASYDNYHYKHIIEAIAHNKHVFVEKPLCLYEREAIKIKSILKSKPKLKISSNLILRKCPRFRFLKDKIKSGAMGKIFHIEGDYNYGRFHKITDGWRGRIDFYSVVYGGAVHMIDLLLWLTEGRVTEVAAYGNNIASRGTQFRYHDTATSILKFENGMTGKVSVHYGCVRPHFHHVAVYGTKATFVNTERHGLWYKSQDPSVEPIQITESYPGVHKGDLIFSFVDSILNGVKAEVSKDDIFETMSVCFAMEKAVQSKSGRVKVKYL